MQAALSVYLGKIKKYTGSMPNISDNLRKESRMDEVTEIWVT